VKLKFLLPLALFVPLLMAPSGGYPVNPTFQSVSIGAFSTANPLVVSEPAAASGLAEFSGNGTVPGSTSLAVGQTAGGQAVILARGAQSLVMGANAGSQIQVASTGIVSFSGNAQAPVVAFDVTLQVAPSIINCFHCQASPTAVRNSIGNYTIQPQSTGNWIWSCTYRNNATQPGGISINSTTTGGVVLLAYTPAGALSDAQGPVQCVGVS
jgi:hypothetical protein